MDKFSWRGLYALGLLLAGLFLVDAVAPVSQNGHELLAIVILAVVFGLVFAWTEEHADLVEHDGIDSLLPPDGSPAVHPMLFVAGGRSIVITPETTSGTRARSNQSHALVQGDVPHRSTQTPG